MSFGLRTTPLPSATVLLGRPTMFVDYLRINARVGFFLYAYNLDVKQMIITVIIVIEKTMAGDKAQLAHNPL